MPILLNRLRPLLLIALLAGCSQEPALENLLARVDALEQAVEARQVAAAMAMLSEDFSTSQGWDRKEAQRLLLFHTMRHRTISLIRTQTDASLDSAYTDQATVRFNLIMTGGEGLLPEQGRRYKVESRWRHRDGDWYLHSLHWEPLL